MDIQTAARRMGHYQWAEGRLFEILGSWVVDTPETNVKEHLAVQCHRHAWHAELWEARAPVLTGAVTSDGVVPTATDAAVVRLIDAVASPTGADTTLEKLVGLYRVFLPRLVGSYRALLAATDPLVDAPTERVLTLVLRDESEAWQDGELLVQSLIHTEADALRAAAQQARLEGIIAATPDLAE